MFKLYIIIVLAVITAEFLFSLLAYFINRSAKKFIEKSTKELVDDLVDDAMKDFPKPNSTRIDYSKPYNDNKQNS